MALVARKTWIRGFGADLRASQARSISASFERARPQIVLPRMLAAISRTASKSPGDAIGKPASMISTPRSTKRLGDLHFFGQVHAGAGGLLAVAERGVEDLDSCVVRTWGSLAVRGEQLLAAFACDALFGLKGDWLILRCLVSKMCLSPFLHGLSAIKQKTPRPGVARPRGFRNSSSVVRTNPKAWTLVGPKATRATS